MIKKLTWACDNCVLSIIYIKNDRFHTICKSLCERNNSKNYISVRIVHRTLYTVMIIASKHSTLIRLTCLSGEAALQCPPWSPLTRDMTVHGQIPNEDIMCTAASTAPDDTRSKCITLNLLVSSSQCNI